MLQREGRVGAMLDTLTWREVVIPDWLNWGREAFVFRHQLIRDAPYQRHRQTEPGGPPRVIRRVTSVSLANRLDEYRAILAYHLEQAARHPRDLDATDPSLAPLAERAWAQLALAGKEALDRDEFLGSANLL